MWNDKYNKLCLKPAIIRHIYLRVNLFHLLVDSRNRVKKYAFMFWMSYICETAYFKRTKRKQLRGLHKDLFPMKNINSLTFVLQELIKLWYDQQSPLWRRQNIDKPEISHWSRETRKCPLSIIHKNNSSERRGIIL